MYLLNMCTALCRQHSLPCSLPGVDSWSTETFWKHHVKWQGEYQPRNQESQHKVSMMWGFPGGTSGKEPTCQCRRQKRHRFNPWVRKIRWRRAWQPTPVFLPGESHGQRSLVGYSPWGPKELDTTEVTEHAHTRTWYEPTALTLHLRKLALLLASFSWLEVEPALAVRMADSCLVPFPRRHIHVIPSHPGRLPRGLTYFPAQMTVMS